MTDSPSSRRMTRAQAFAEWKLQGNFISNALRALGHKKSAKHLEKALEDLDILWSLDMGIEYTEAKINALNELEDILRTEGVFHD